MRQHAGLNRRVEAHAHLIEHGEEISHALDAVRDRVDADDRVAGAIHQPVDDARRNTCGIIGRVVRLQPRGKPARQPDGVAERRGHPALGRDRDEVLEAHDLAHTRRHLGREAGSERGERCGVGLLAQQPIAQSPNGEAAHRRECRGIVGVDDEPRHLIALVRDHRVVEELRERRLRQRHLGGHPLGSAVRRDAGELVAGARAATPWRAGP